MLKKILSICTVITLLFSFGTVSADSVVFTEDFSGDISNLKTYVNNEESDGILSYENGGLHFNAVANETHEFYGYHFGALEPNTTYHLTAKARVTEAVNLGYMCVNLFGYTDENATEELPKTGVNSERVSEVRRNKVTTEWSEINVVVTTGNEPIYDTVLNVYCCCYPTNWYFVHNFYITDLKLEKKSIKEISDGRISKAIVLGLGSDKALVNDVEKQVDPENADVTPKIVNNRTLVPMRFIAENLEAEVDWNEETQTVTLDVKGKKVSMQIGSRTLDIDGYKMDMDVAPELIESRAMIPLRVLAETIFRKFVFWDNKGLIIVSDYDNILDSTKDSSYIDNLLAKLK